MLLKLSPKVTLNVMMGTAIALVFEMGLPLFSDQPMGAIAQTNTNGQGRIKDSSKEDVRKAPGASRAKVPSGRATTPSSNSNRDGTGAGRPVQGACPTNVPIPLTALIPEETTVSNEGRSLTYSLAKTAASRPRLWVYMPYTTANGFELELEVQQEGRTDAPWKQSLLSPKTPGVIRLSVPGTMPKLVVGQLYKWSLTVKCNPINRVSGWIERVDDPVSSSVVGLAKAAAYAKAEIWYDALTVLGDLRRNGSPAEQKAAFEAWKKLLTDAPMKLPDVATQEIVPN